MKIRLIEDGKMVVMGDDDEPVEVVQVATEGKAAEQGAALPSKEEQPVDKQQWFAHKIGAVSVDAKHPYVVVLNGVPLFSSSSKVPDRVKAMVLMGLPSQAFIVVDARSGEAWVPTPQQGKES